MDVISISDKTGSPEVKKPQPVRKLVRITNDKPISVSSESSVYYPVSANSLKTKQLFHNYSPANKTPPVHIKVTSWFDKCAKMEKPGSTASSSPVKATLPSLYSPEKDIQEPRSSILIRYNFKEEGEQKTSSPKVCSIKRLSGCENGMNSSTSSSKNQQNILYCPQSKNRKRSIEELSPSASEHDISIRKINNTTIKLNGSSPKLLKEDEIKSETPEEKSDKSPSAPLSPESRKKNEFCSYLQLINLSATNLKDCIVNQYRRSSRVQNLAIKRDLKKKQQNNNNSNNKKQKIDQAPDSEAEEIKIKEEKEVEKVNGLKTKLNGKHSNILSKELNIKLQRLAKTKKQKKESSDSDSDSDFVEDSESNKINNKFLPSIENLDLQKEQDFDQFITNYFNNEGVNFKNRCSNNGLIKEATKEELNGSIKSLNQITEASPNKKSSNKNNNKIVKKAKRQYKKRLWERCNRYSSRVRKLIEYAPKKKKMNKYKKLLMKKREKNKLQDSSSSTTNVKVIDANNSVINVKKEEEEEKVIKHVEVKILKVETHHHESEEKMDDDELMQISPVLENLRKNEQLKNLAPEHFKALVETKKFLNPKADDLLQTGPLKQQTILQKVILEKPDHQKSVVSKLKYDESDYKNCKEIEEERFKVIREQRQQIVNETSMIKKHKDEVKEQNQEIEIVNVVKNDELDQSDDEEEDEEEGSEEDIEDDAISKESCIIDEDDDDDEEEEEIEVDDEVCGSDESTSKEAINKPKIKQCDNYTNTNVQKNFVVIEKENEKEKKTVRSTIVACDSSSQHERNQEDSSSDATSTSSFHSDAMNGRRQKLNEIRMSVETVNTEEITSTNCDYIPLSSSVEVKSLHRSLVQSKRKSLGGLDSDDYSNQHWESPSPSTNMNKLQLTGKKHRSSFSIHISEDYGDVLNVFYIDYNLVIAQELMVSFWNQTALGNVLGSQNMWLPKGCIQRLVLDTECCQKSSKEMMVSVESSAAYIELWTKEHKSFNRERPVADVFAAVYFSRNGSLDKKVLQLENIKGFADDVQYIVLRNSLSIIVSWNTIKDDERTTIVHTYNLASDYQTVVNIKELASVNHYVSSLHNIEDCDSIIMGAGDHRLTLWNVEYGYIVATIDLMEPRLEPKTLWVKCDRGFLFALQMFEDEVLRLIAINGMNHKWKKLQVYKASERHNNLKGVCIENGILTAFYETGVSCWNVQMGECVLDELLTETVFVPSSKHVMLMADDEIHIRNALSYLLTMYDV